MFIAKVAYPSIFLLFFSGTAAGYLQHFYRCSAAVPLKNKRGGGGSGNYKHGTPLGFGDAWDQSKEAKQMTNFGKRKRFGAAIFCHDEAMPWRALNFICLGRSIKITDSPSN